MNRKLLSSRLKKFGPYFVLLFSSFAHLLFKLSLDFANFSLLLFPQQLHLFSQQLFTILILIVQKFDFVVVLIDELLAL
jgi:hypothetical protein